jgi:hypothetical protein
VHITSIAAAVHWKGEGNRRVGTCAVRIIILLLSFMELCGKNVVGVEYAFKFSPMHAFKFNFKTYMVVLIARTVLGPIQPPVQWIREALSRPLKEA